MITKHSYSLLTIQAYEWTVRKRGGGLLGDQNNKFVFQFQKPPGAHSEEYGTHKATRHFWTQIWKNFLHLVWRGKWRSHLHIAVSCIFGKAQCSEMGLNLRVIGNHLECCIDLDLCYCINRLDQFYTMISSLLFMVAGIWKFGIVNDLEKNSD